MSRHFFYKRKDLVPQGKDALPKVVTYIDSFNVDFVVRSFQPDENHLVVLLNDGHEESREVPDIVKGVQKGTKRERNWFVSNITLEGDDVAAFREFMGYTAPAVEETNPAQLPLFPKNTEQ